MTKIKEAQHNLKNMPLLRNDCNRFTTQAGNTRHGRTAQPEPVLPGEKNANSSAFWHRETRFRRRPTGNSPGQQKGSAGEGDPCTFSRSLHLPCAAPNQPDSSPLSPPWAPRALFHLPASPVCSVTIATNSMRLRSLDPDGAQPAQTRCPGTRWDNGGTRGLQGSRAG